MKNKILFSVLIIAYSMFAFSCTHKREKKIRLSEDDLLVVTERAFLDGYKAALLKHNRDTVWIRLSNEYREFFK